MSGELEGGDIVKVVLGGTTLAGLLWGAVKLLGGRQISQHDQTMKKLTEAIEHLNTEIQGLREQNVRMAEKMGAQESATAANKERIDETSKYWREQHEKLAERVAEIERSPKFRRK